MLILSGKLGSVGVLRFAPDGATIAAGGRRAGLEFWPVRGGEPGRRARKGGPVTDLRFHPSGHTLYTVARGGTAVAHRLGTLDPSQGQPIQQHADRLGISDDGAMLLMTGRFSLNWAGSRVAGYDLRGDIPQRIWFDSEEPEVGLCWGITWLPGTDRFAVAERTGEYPNHTTRLLVKDGRTGRTLAACGRPGLRTDRLAASAGCLAACDRATLTCWPGYDLQKEPVVLRNDTRKHFTDMAFHPSGRWLAAASSDGTVKLYDATTWTVARAYTWDVGELGAVAFSPDGMLAAVGSDTGRIVVWDVDL